MASDDPTLPTSAQLRQTQAALAASQQDLTTARAAIDNVETYRKIAAEQCDRAEAERDDAKATARRWRDRFNEANEAEEAALEQAGRYRHRLDLARAELSSARQELDTYRDGRLWQVAQRPVAPCSSCSQPILRGQAFQPLADAKGFFSHCFCPDKES